MQSDSRAEAVMLEQLREERDTAREDARRVRAALLTAQERAEEAERARDSLRLERDGLEHVRLQDNAYLIERAEAAEQQLSALREAHWQELYDNYGKAVADREIARLCALSDEAGKDRA